MMERFPVMAEFLSPLGIAGKDVTLRYRFEGSDARGQIAGFRWHPTSELNLNPIAIGRPVDF